MNMALMYLIFHNGWLLNSSLGERWPASSQGIHMDIERFSARGFSTSASLVLYEPEYWVAVGEFA